MTDSRRKSRIFVVDDEEVISSTIAAILRLNGFEAIAFTEPLKALDACSSKAPDLLISDVVMPRLSGVQLAMYVQQGCPSCKVLLFSGQAAIRDPLGLARKQGYEFEIVAKPIAPTALLKKVEAMLARIPPSASASPDRRSVEAG
jgi:DNA-binding NtrC family response regulator